MKFVFFQNKFILRPRNIKLNLCVSTSIELQTRTYILKKLFSLLPRYLHNREFYYIYKEVIFQIDVIVYDAQTFDGRNAL